MQLALVAFVCDGNGCFVAGWHGLDVPRVRRDGVLSAGGQEAVAVLHPTGVRERCGLGPGARTRIRDRVQRAARAGARTFMAGAVARRAGCSARVLLPHFHPIPRFIGWRRRRWARFRSAPGSAGPPSRRCPALGCRSSAGAQARSQPAEPTRRHPAPVGGRAGAAAHTGASRPAIGGSARHSERSLGTEAAPEHWS